MQGQAAVRYGLSVERGAWTAFGDSGRRPLVAIYRVWVRCCGWTFRKAAHAARRRQARPVVSAPPTPTVTGSRTSSREALAEGRLDADEHAERIDGVSGRAKTLGELEPLVRDLPAAHGGARPRARPTRPTGGASPVDPDDNVVAIFSGAARKGRWRAGRRIHAFAVFGGVEIDLTEALFEYQQVVIKAIAVFGSVEIRVPENVIAARHGALESSATSRSARAESPSPHAPVVVVKGRAVFGSIEARPKRGKLDGGHLAPGPSPGDRSCASPWT